MASKCIFCGIVNGTEPARVLYRDDRVVAFRDIRPCAVGHYQVVPVRHIGTCKDLTPADVPLLEHMLIVGKRVLEEQHGSGVDAVGAGEWTVRSKFGFHMPPFNSVDHLHMHCFALPIKLLHRVRFSAAMPWFADAAMVIARLAASMDQS